ATNEIAQTGLSSLPPVIYYSEQLFRCQRSPIPVGLLITAPELGPQQIKEKEHLLNPDYLETGKQFFVGWGTLK
ncbi:hypothetical protein, partial [Aeromonas caviae]|uniref:hypothetical protein n=1 Tax=Aeromonas caviae TaxID=648 RepID=UPI003F748570